MGYLSGPLTVTIQHAGVGGVYERSGPPSIWGSGLVHEDIEGTDDSPVFVGEYTHTGEAQGPVDAPRAVMGATVILGLLAVVALGAAVLMPSHDDKQKRTNPRSKQWLLNKRRKAAKRGWYKRRKRAAA